MKSNEEMARSVLERVKKAKFTKLAMVTHATCSLKKGLHNVIIRCAKLYLFSLI